MGSEMCIRDSVNGGGRVETSSSGTEDGMTAETIRDTEDPERR